MTNPVHTDPPPIDYASRDYRNIRSDGITLIPYFLPEWTDHNQTDLGIALIGDLAAMEDRLHYYIDRTPDQMAITRAISRERVIILGRGINYKHGGPDAASVDLTVTTDGAVVLAAYDLQVTSSTGESFENSAGITFAGAGTLTGQPFVHGRLIDDNPLFISDGRANQSGTFTTSSVLDDPITVFVGGVAWTEVDAITQYEASDQVYYLQRNDDDSMTVHFGDGVHGQIPPVGSTVRATYRVGGGTAGQIEAGGISTATAAYGPNMTFTNPLGSSGGGPSENIDDIRVNAPRNWATQERCVTAADYQTKALLVSGVAKAKAYPMYVNSILLYVAPTGGGTATAALLTAVEAYLATFQMATDSVTAVTASYIDSRVAGTVYVLSTYQNSAIESAVNTAVTNFLDFTNRELGEVNKSVGDVKFSNLIEVIEGTTGVDYVDITEFRIEPSPVYTTWSNPAVTINTIGINSQTQAETWYIQFTSTTEFTAWGSVSGIQASAGTIVVPYTSDDGRISFVVSGAAVMVAGDRAEFRTSRYIATNNIKVGRGEIAQLLVGGLSLDYTGGTL